MSFRFLSGAFAAKKIEIFKVPSSHNCGRLPALALLAALTFFHFSAPASAQTATEQACFDAVQGQVAWSQGGPTAWDPTNVNNLCRGAVDYQARIACFTAGIANHNDWARAIGECQATGASAAAPSAPAAAPATSSSFAPVTGSPVRIESSQDRSRAVNVLDSENPVASNFPADQPSTQWIIVPAQESPFYRLSSVVRPNLFLNNQGGMLTTSTTEAGWFSAQWTFESGDGKNWRVCNRWTNECLRFVNGGLTLAAAAPGEADALWAIPGAPQAVGTLTPVAVPDPDPEPTTVVVSAETPSEKACFDAVQGKVAWSQAGGTNWDPANIKNLCKGAVDPQARIACFSARIQKLDDWAKAIEGCRNAGTTTASSGTSSSTNLSAANSGTTEEQACFNAVQGKVAWNREGATLWGRSAVIDLCKGAVDYPTRIACFKDRIVSHGNVSQAIVDCQGYGLLPVVTIVATAQEQACKNDLLAAKYSAMLSSDEPTRQAQADRFCRGAVNAPARVSCFENYYQKTNSVSESTDNCKTSGTTAQAKKVFRLESLFVGKTTEQDPDEVYLLITKELLGGSMVRVPEGRTTAKVAPAGNTNYKYFYPSMSMSADDPSLRLWNICMMVTPKPNIPTTIIVRDKDWDYDRADDSLLANKDDVIGRLSLVDVDHPSSTYGRHVVTLAEDGIYYLTYQVAETEQELPTCMPSEIKDLGLEARRGNTKPSPCENMCNRAFNGDPFGQCDIGPGEGCSSIALVYVGCVLACEASGGP